ncbi:hypothetical protein ACFPC0_19445 [Streptomyces andamanensis]|uniref:Uncharacterized protein n=1 Tax=Streptomyces andamanensis TaxID=1565035 RepID=A0ABV8THN5_9ACTN
MEETRKDILGSGTVLESKQYTGTYDHRYDSWDIPVELGIGIDAVDDGQATVRLVQHRAGGSDTISQVVSYINGRRMFHKVTVGEFLPAGSRTGYSAENYTLRLREADDAYRTLRAAFEAPDGRAGHYQDLLRLTTSERAGACPGDDRARPGRAPCGTQLVHLVPDRVRVRRRRVVPQGRLYPGTDHRRSRGPRGGRHRLHP